MVPEAEIYPKRRAELAPTVAWIDPDIFHVQKAALGGHRLGNFIHRKWNSKGSGSEGSSVGAREERRAGKQLPLDDYKPGTG